MNTIIEKIRAEVERLKVDYLNRSYTFVPKVMQDLLDFLSDLEKGCQWSAEDETKIAYICDVMSGKELVSDISPSYRSEIIEFAKSLLPAKVKSEKPINPVLQDFPTTEKEMQDFLATHERIPVPERLNSLERILQEQPVCEDLKKRASEIYPNKEGDLCYLHSTLQRGGYIRGYQDCKEQMLKEAVEGEVVKDISNKLAVTAKNVNLDGFKFGDRVKLIIVKED